MASISSIGLGANIDAESIITQLLTLEKQPITKVESENTKLNTKLSTWGRIQSGFSALESAATALTRDGFWSATTATTSDATAVSVTTGTDSPAGAYSVQVQQLAQSQYITSGAYAAKDTVVGEGTLRIELGTFTANPTAPPAATFAAKAAATAVDIEIGPGDNTLEKIRDRINSANAGVTASLVNDATGTRLVLRGSSGKENAFRVSVTESGAAGLSALAYDPSADITTMTESQKASDARATINGVQVTSASNTLTNVIDGLSLKLGKVTTSPVDVNVDRDNTSIRTGIDNFVKAYNDLVGLIRVQTLYDEASKTAGPLQGDSAANGLMRQLRSLAVSSTTGSSVFDRLSSVGLEMNKDGTFTTNSTKLTSAMGNLTELKKLFATDNESDVNQQGLAVRFKNLASQVTDSDGAISSRTDGIKSTIERNEDKIERLEDRITRVEARLRAQYTALDQSMAKLNGLSTYVSAQLAALSDSS